MNRLSYLLTYFLVSIFVCGFLGALVYVKLAEVLVPGSISHSFAAIVLFYSIGAGLLTFGFRTLRDGPINRRHSANAIVFLVSFGGLFITSIFAGAMIYLVDALIPIGEHWLVFKYRLAGFFGATTFWPPTVTLLLSPSSLLSTAVFGAVFGLPLARMAIGARIRDAWRGQSGTRWLLFWRCGVAAVVLSILSTIIALFAQLFLLDMHVRRAAPPDFSDGIGFLTFYQPTTLELTLSFVMILLAHGLHVGAVAYFSEGIRRRID